MKSLTLTPRDQFLAQIGANPSALRFLKSFLPKIQNAKRDGVQSLLIDPDDLDDALAAKQFIEDFLKNNPGIQQDEVVEFSAGAFRVIITAVDNNVEELENILRDTKQVESCAQLFGWLNGVDLEQDLTEPKITPIEGLLTQIHSDELDAEYQNIIKKVSEDEALQIKQCEESKAVLFDMNKRPEVADKAVGSIARAVTSMVYNNQINQEVFSKQDTRDLLVGNFTKATSERSMASIASAIHGVTYQNEEARKLYGTPEVKGFLLGALNKASNDKDIINIAGSISSLVCNKENMTLYGDQETYQALHDAFKKDGLSSKAKGNLAAAIANIASSEALYQNRETVDLLLGVLQDETNDDNTRSYAATGLRNIIHSEKGAELLKDPELMGAIYDAAISTPDKANAQFKGRAASLLGNIFDNPASKDWLNQEGNSGKFQEAKSKLLEWGAGISNATKDSFGQSVVDSQPLSSITWALGRINAISDKKVFADVETKNTLLGMAEDVLAKGMPDKSDKKGCEERDKAISAINNAITNITYNNADAKELYGDERTYNVMQGFIESAQELGPESESRGSVARAIANISIGTGGERFCNEDTKKTLLGWGREAKDDQSIASIASAIGNLAYHENNRDKIHKSAETNKDPKIFAGDKDVTETLGEMGKKAGSEKSQQALARATNYVGEPTLTAEAPKKWADKVVPPLNLQKSASWSEGFTSKRGSQTERSFVDEALNPAKSGSQTVR